MKQHNEICDQLERAGETVSMWKRVWWDLDNLEGEEAAAVKVKLRTARQAHREAAQRYTRSLDRLRERRLLKYTRRVRG